MPLLHRKCSLGTSSPLLDPLLVASHLCIDPNPSLGVSSENTCALSLAVYDVDVTSGGGGILVLRWDKQIPKRNIYMYIYRYVY